MQTWNSFEKAALWSQTAQRSSAPETSWSRPGAGCWLAVKAEKCSEEAAVLGTGVPWDDLGGPPGVNPRFPLLPGCCAPGYKAGPGPPHVALHPCPHGSPVEPPGHVLGSLPFLRPPVLQPPRQLSENKDGRAASHSASCSPASRRCVADGKRSLGSRLCPPVWEGGGLVLSPRACRVCSAESCRWGRVHHLISPRFFFHISVGSALQRSSSLLGQEPLGMEGTLVQLVGGLRPQHLQIQTPPPTPRLSRASASEPQHPFMPKINNK